MDISGGIPDSEGPYPIYINVVLLMFASFDRVVCLIGWSSMPM